MGDIDNRILNHAKRYQQKGEDRIRFARFLFVDIPNISDDIVQKLSDTDRDVLNLPYMRDKNRVFTVVYDYVEDEIGGPITVEEKDRYLTFKRKHEDDG